MLAALPLGTHAVRAQTSPSRQGPPVRQIATAAAVSKQPIGQLGAVRELPDGRVLVNDVGSRRLLLLDTLLQTERVVLDSASEKENTYGTRAGALIGHRGDSTLFVDPGSLALLVLDPRGDIVRVRSVPRAQDVFRYGSTGFGGSGTGAFTDARGRIVYRVNARPAPPARRPPRGVPYIPSEPDSAFVVALDPETRRLDTLGAVRTPKQEVSVRVSPTGGWNWSSTVNPVPTADEWAVLSDGTVAFVRWLDYRVDYLNPDGTRSSSDKIPHDWQPISAADKERIVDSVTTERSRSQRMSYVTSVIRYVNTYGRKYPQGFTAPEGYRPPSGFARGWRLPPGVTIPPDYIYACAPSEEAKLVSAEGDTVDASASPTTMMRGGRPTCVPQPVPNLARVPEPPTLRDVSVSHPRHLPDFYPPFTSGAVRADMDGNLWVRAEQRDQPRGGPVYDVISRQGKLTDRLQLPRGYQLVGFGRDRVVFLGMRDREGVHLARVRLR